MPALGGIRLWSIPLAYNMNPTAAPTSISSLRPLLGVLLTNYYGVSLFGLPWGRMSSSNDHSLVTGYQGVPAEALRT